MTIALQLPLRPAFPNAYGPVDFQEYRKIYQQIDQILVQSNVEMTLIAKALSENDRKATEHNVAWFLSGFRCAIARKLCKMPLREFIIRLADSNFLQWFTHCGDYGLVPPCSKSTLERFEKMYDLSELENLIDSMTLGAAEPREDLRLGALNQALDLEDVFADCTCVKANIHYPVDWVLLVDGVRTLMLSIKLIRKHGLKHRMPAPENFLSQINALAMTMSSSRRARDGRKKRKRICRKLKKTAQTVIKHGERYRDILDVESY